MKRRYPAPIRKKYTTTYSSEKKITPSSNEILLDSKVETLCKVWRDNGWDNLSTAFWLARDLGRWVDPSEKNACLERTWRYSGERVEIAPREWQKWYVRDKFAVKEIDALLLRAWKPNNDYAKAMEKVSIEMAVYEQKRYNSEAVDLLVNMVDPHRRRVKTQSFLERKTSPQSKESEDDGGEGDKGEKDPDSEDGDKDPESREEEEEIPRPKKRRRTEESPAAGGECRDT